MAVEAIGAAEEIWMNLKNRQVEWMKSASKVLRPAAAVAVMALTTQIASAGPDVIVGDLPNISDFGTLNSRHAYAVGTTSCNLGDAILTWTAGNNQHPVISQNIYRLANGRFQQLSQAWLKHGFCSLQGTVCMACTPGGDCNGLFPGCSDPYSSGLNGGQSGLGPKSEVNAATGAFPYPWVNRGTTGDTGDSNYKHLQPLVTDVDPASNAGALYFVSSMYVQPEDAAANNKNNNESYRRVTIGAAPGLAMTLQDSTQRQKPGIQAWKDQDATVTLTNIDVAGDGRFIVGVKATLVSGTTYHYEYAIQNLNSDRSGQSFSVPIPNGTTITSVGFSDVDYHSGEPYALTDWTSSVTSTAVTWSTQTFAQNANANALRWDTTYNFWFNANVAPGNGSSTITLFKTGSPTSVGACTVVPGGAGAPCNDACASAASAGTGSQTLSFNNTGATQDGPIECLASGNNQIGADLWYIWTNGPCTGTATITTCGSTFDTKIAVYNGTTCPTTTSSIACNDDSSTCAANSLQSAVTFSATGNAQYLVRVGGFNGATGAGTLNFTSPGGCGPVAPPNDLCANAIALANNVTANGTNVNATVTDAIPAGVCGTSDTTPDVWYTFQNGATVGTVTVTTCDTATNQDTVVSVYTGACGALTQIGCNDDTGGTCALRSTVTIANAPANQLYRVRVSGYNGITGAFTIRATGTAGGATPPANNDCANRAGIGLGATAFTTVNATTDGPTHAGCLYFGNNQITNDVWYNHPSQAAGRLLISTCNDVTFDSKIAVYRNSGCTNFDARLINCIDDTATCGTTTKVIVPVGPGQNYTLRIGGYNGATGTGNVTLTRFCVADTDDGTGTGFPDGGVGIEDLLYFLGLYNSGSILGDCDDGSGTGVPDGGIGIEDLLYYLERYNNGC